MPDGTVGLNIRLEDVELDEEGNVTIMNPDVARMVAAAAGGGVSQAATNNCHGGNCAAGCGVKPK